MKRIQAKYHPKPTNPKKIKKQKQIKKRKGKTILTPTFWKDSLPIFTLLIKLIKFQLIKFQ